MPDEDAAPFCLVGGARLGLVSSNASKLKVSEVGWGKGTVRATGFEGPARKVSSSSHAEEVIALVGGRDGSEGAGDGVWVCRSVEGRTGWGASRSSKGVKERALLEPDEVAFAVELEPRLSQNEPSASNCCLCFSACSARAISACFCLSAKDRVLLEAAVKPPARENKDENASPLAAGLAGGFGVLERCVASGRRGCCGKGAVFGVDPRIGGVEVE